MPFSNTTLDFLFENRLQNSKAWFDQHKPDYTRYVLEPLQELVKLLTPCMLELDDLLTTDPRVDKTISRIRRDTRFSKDKFLYRDNMWVVFKRGKMHGTVVPGFYFELFSNGTFGYGCGFYHASPEYMDTMRSLILENDKSFFKASQAYREQAVFHMEGDCYKRPRYPDAPAAFQGWLQRKNICFCAESSDTELLFSPQLRNKLAEDFKLLAPIYQFLLATAEKQRQDSAAKSYYL